jgi:polyphosphate kinase
VHSKLCLITRREGRKSRHFAAIGTGNFNEETARMYTDHLLLTSDSEIAGEVAQVFEFFRNNYRVPAFRQLVVSPFGSRNQLLEKIDAERRNARKGKPAWILLRLNNLADSALIGALTEASREGVEVRILVRSMNALSMNVPGVTDAIEARCLVGRFLEHSRILMFANGGKPSVYMTSADWMMRNMDERVEVACPVRDRRLRQELIDEFEMQWRDTENARVWNDDDAEIRLDPSFPRFDSQSGIRDWLASFVQDGDRRGNLRE